MRVVERKCHQMTKARIAFGFSIESSWHSHSSLQKTSRPGTQSSKILQKHAWQPAGC